MRIRKPSPAMAVAVVALVMATTGSAVAAIDYARNAGAVDGLSAVNAGSSTNRAAGRLVATARGGSHKGQIPAKFLAEVPRADTLGQLFDVPDNAQGALVEVHRSGFGTLGASCNDQNRTAGNEDPSSTIAFTNGSGASLNLARTVGNTDAVIGSLAHGTVHSFAINGSNTFEIQLEINRVNVVYRGHVRQDGRGTADAKCLVVGTAEVYLP